MEGAIDLGADVVELDLHLTRDGVLVVTHDARLSPALTRDARGRWLLPPTPLILELDARELEAYDVGRIRPGSAYARRLSEQRGADGVRIPTLRAAIAAAERRAGGRVRYNLEVKTSPERPEESAPPAIVSEAVVALVRELGVESRTIVESFDWRALKRVQEIAPGVATSCLTKEATVPRRRPGPSPWTAGLALDAVGGSLPRLARAAGCAIWSPDGPALRAGEVAEAHRLGLRVIPWFVEPWSRAQAAAIRRAVAWGVDGVITDHPARLRRLLRRAAAPRARCAAADGG